MIQRLMICAFLALAGCETAPPQVSRAPATVINVPQVGVGQVLNTMRAQYGLPPLRRNATLDRIARAHAAEMVATGQFSHVGRDGRGSWQRAQAAGYNPRLMAENIAWGPFETGEVLQMWQDRADHRSNQMHPRAQEYGLGVAGTGSRRHWVLVVGASF